MTAVVATAIVIITAVVLYVFLSDSGMKKSTTAVETPPPPPIAQPLPPAVETTTATAQPTDSAAATSGAAYPADSLVLEVTARDSVWVSVLADTAHVQRGVLQKGAHGRWSAKSKFLVTLGNSKLLTVLLNGKPLLPADSNARVLRNMVITAGTTSLAGGEGTPAPAPKAAPTPAPVRTAPGTAPKKSVPAKPATPPTTKGAATKGAPTKSAAAKPAPKRRPRPVIRPFPDTIRKVPIR